VTKPLPFRVMDVDRILPRSRGGTDAIKTLQLLCSGCNRSKRAKTMAEWRGEGLMHSTMACNQIMSGLVT